MAACSVKRILSCILFLSSIIHIDNALAQSLNERYGAFRQIAYSQYSSFREGCNERYARFLRDGWGWFEGKAPLPLPEDKNPVPPLPYNDDAPEPVTVEPVVVRPAEDEPQPMPVAPVKEVPVPEEDGFDVSFYGLTCGVRLPECAKMAASDMTPERIAAAWERLSTDEMNNAIRDCLEARIRYQMSDWAYLQFLDALGRQYCGVGNGATLLTAFLYCQSGYQMRLGMDGERIVMLFGTRHQIYDRAYFELDGSNFYPLGATAESIKICNAAFEGESPMSLFIDRAQNLGTELTAERVIAASGESARSRVPKALVEFYNGYPVSMIGGNPLTRWAICAQAPLAEASRESLYPGLKAAIVGLPEREAAEKLLGWVQTGFVYEYDDKVWGHDRAFFAEETLNYPYCDCEDRSILYSRLVRDLLRLDVALIYYPGHLATAVCFNEAVEGDAMMIGGRRFTVCDPTYIGAPVGAQMPDLEYDKAQAIVL